MTIEQRVAVLEEIFSKIQDYYTSAYSGEEIDARLASAGVPIGITKEYKSVAEMNQDFTGTDVQRGQFVLILPDSTSSADYGKVYLKGTANWVYAFTLTTLTSIKGPIGPPGKKGDQGDPGEAGSSFAILGYFDTLDALKATVPNPKAGDVYGVGTAPPYNIYIWDSVHGKWVANGNLQGPEGPVGGSSNFVRYDAAQNLTDEQKAQARTNIGADTVQGAVLYTPQSLTDAQKTQARGNIGAAPDGFGLGGSATMLTSADNLDTLMKNGWFQYRLNNPPQGTLPTVLVSYASLIRVSTAGAVCVQEAFDATDSLFHGTVLRRTIYGLGAGAKIYPWEWVNPPIQLGGEYRTTERYMGKPVYVKLVNFGALPNTTYRVVTHGISNIEYVIKAYGSAGNKNIPTNNFNGTSPYLVSVVADKTDIAVLTDFDASAYSSNIIVKYTKTTD